MLEQLTVKVKTAPAYAGLPLPEYASEAAAGLDLLACLAPEEELVLQPGQRALVPTGLFLELPPDCEAQVRPRSGLALRHGITLLNSPGTIDADYRGEVGAGAFCGAARYAHCSVGVCPLSAGLLAAGAGAFRQRARRGWFWPFRHIIRLGCIC